MPPPNLTIIVAGTPTLGIGKASKLPWSLKSELSYFSRVTRRLPTPSSSPSSSSSSSSSSPPSVPSQQQKRKNAVIMGRKTYESIPPRFRPLPGRINIILSRGLEGGGRGGWKSETEAESSSSQKKGGEKEREATKEKEGVKEKEDEEEEEYWLSSLSQALSFLSSKSTGAAIGRVFVIGGAEVYAAALKHGDCVKSVLWTTVFGEFGCDTFFPADIRGTDGVGGSGWVRRGHEELCGFVGESVPEGRQEERGVGFEFEFYERV